MDAERGAVAMPDMTNPPLQDHAAARRMMVLGQITPNGVNDPPLVNAFREVPREAFLPPALAPRAYADEAVPLGGGRVLLAPMVLGRLLQLLMPSPGERALVLGAGTGYGAALLAQMGVHVTAIESDAGLAAAARAALPRALACPPPEVLVADPAAGLPGGAPYRLMLIEGAVAQLPAAVTDQLGEGGRLALVRTGKAGPVCRAVLIRRAGGSLSEHWAFETTCPPLPDFSPPPAFMF